MSLRSGFNWIGIPVSLIELASDSSGLLFETKMEGVQKSPGMHSSFLPSSDRATFGPLAVLMQRATSVLAGLSDCRLYFQAQPSVEGSLAPAEAAAYALEMFPNGRKFLNRIGTSCFVS